MNLCSKHDNERNAPYAMWASRSYSSEWPMLQKWCCFVRICPADNWTVALPDEIHTCQSQKKKYHISLLTCFVTRTKPTRWYATNCDNLSNDWAKTCLALPKIKTNVKGNAPVYTQPRSARELWPILVIHASFTNCRSVAHEWYVLCHDTKHLPHCAWRGWRLDAIVFQRCSTSFWWICMQARRRTYTLN